jgi:zinc transport system substrate-binding protein
MQLVCIYIKKEVKCLLKKFMSIILILSLAVGLCACNNSADAKTTNDKIKVVVSFNAMKELTYAVGKDKVDIDTIIPEGQEPHDYEPKIRDLASLADAKLFVYSGMDLEKWASTAIDAASNKDLIAVDASKGFKPIKTSSGAYDPHVWISLKGAEYEANQIKEGLIKADPKDKAYFEKNYSAFKSQTDSLYSEYKTKFANSPKKSFVTGHAAFSYMCRDFNLQQNSVEDVFADGEPSSQKLQELITYCQKNKVTTVFVEDMVSPKISETLASEVGAKVEKIYTVESKEDNLDYIESMKKNLDNIYKSLQ